MGYILWEPKRIKNVEQDCQRLNKAKGKDIRCRKMKIMGKRRHLITDYAHTMPKLHCPWDDGAKKKRNEISPGKLYHGLHSTDVTERLKIKPPRHSAHPSFGPQPEEYHGRQAQDVTEMYTFASRGKRPPSRDHYYGREATDISEFLRIIPPVAKEGDETNEFFGRPKSDITDFNLFPLRTIDTNSRTEAARPLGRCPPGPMCDYAPLIRDENGKIVRPQPERPPSPVCTSGTHDVPTPTLLTGPLKHQQFEGSEQQLVPGAGGILAQIVPGHSRLEAKRPLGKCVPGVMTDYVELVRDETGKVTNGPGRRHWIPSQERHPDECGDDEVCHQREAEAVQYPNRDARKRPLGKVPVGVMHDFVPNPAKGKHKHTTDGYWNLPAAYPPSPPFAVDPETFPADGSGDKTSEGQLSPGPMNQKECDINAAETLKGVEKKLKKDRRRNHPCEMHQPGCPFAAEQGHVGSCITHPTISSYNKWPKDSEPCKKHGGRTGVFSVRASPCTSARAAGASWVGSPTSSAGVRFDCNASNVDKLSTASSRPRSPCSQQSPLKPDTACPRVACQCSRLVNKGKMFPVYGYEDSISRLDPKYPKTKRPGSTANSIMSHSSKPPRSVKKPPTKKSIAFVTEETSPQHFKPPYFGLAQTYVTNPAVSPNLTPPIREAARKGPIQQENIPTRNEETKSCSQADVCKHHQDGKRPWFGRSKTYVTDPAVSPNLTPPCFQPFFR